MCPGDATGQEEPEHRTATPQLCPPTGFSHRPGLPSRWPQFLLYTQVDSEALDRPLLLRPVTLGGHFSQVGTVGRGSSACKLPSPTPAPRRSRKLSHQSPSCSLSSHSSCSLWPQSTLSPQGSVPAGRARVMIPSPCCLAHWRFNSQQRPDTATSWKAT